MDLKEQIDQLDIRKCVVIGLGLTAFYYVLLFDSGERLERSMAANKAAIAKQQGSLQQVRKALEDQKKFEKEIKNIEKNMKDFQKYFVQPMSLNDLSEKISQFAETSNVVINNMKPGEKVAEFPDYPETILNFVVEGSFHDIMEFISFLTQMNKAIDFSEMAFGTVTGGDFPIIKLTATLVVYSSKDGLDAKVEGNNG